jgi:hypothetical protein
MPHESPFNILFQNRIESQLVREMIPCEPTLVRPDRYLRSIAFEHHMVSRFHKLLVVMKFSHLEMAT